MRFKQSQTATEAAQKSGDVPHACRNNSYIYSRHCLVTNLSHNREDQGELKYTSETTSNQVFPQQTLDDVTFVHTRKAHCPSKLNQTEKEDEQRPRNVPNEIIIAMSSIFT